MEKIICDRCGREIPHDDTNSIGVNVDHGGDCVGYDLCADCAKAFDDFMEKKDPCERCGRMCTLPDPKEREGLPEGAVEGMFNLNEISLITGIPVSSVRRLLARANLEGQIGFDKGHVVKQFYMTVHCWKALYEEIKSYRPRKGGRK